MALPYSGWSRMVSMSDARDPDDHVVEVVDPAGGPRYGTPDHQADDRRFFGRPSLWALDTERALRLVPGDRPSHLRSQENPRVPRAVVAEVSVFGPVRLAQCRPVFRNGAALSATEQRPYASCLHGSFMRTPHSRCGPFIFGSYGPSDMKTFRMSSTATRSA
jgi:hypothetical protein